MDINEKLTEAKLIKSQLRNASSMGNENTHVCICKGAYKINRKKWNTMNFYESIARSCVPSICERLPKKFPLFFDIDGIDVEIEVLNTIIYKVIKKCMFLEEGSDEYYVSQNKSKGNSYHIYYPKIIVNKDICLTLADIINTETDNKNTIDTKPYKTGGLRMLGVLKWNKERKTYVENSGHILISGSNQEILEKDLAEQMKYLSVRVLQKSKLIKVSPFFTDKKTTLATKFVDSKYNKRDKKYFEKNIFNKKGVHYLVRTILFDCLDEKRLNSKDLWNSVMFCLKNIEDKFLIKVKNIGIEWSKKSKHYKETDDWLQKQVESIWKLGEFKKEYGIKKLYKLAKEDNPEEYFKLVSGVSKWRENETEYISLDFIRFCFDREDLGDAELFSRLYKMPEQRIVCSRAKKGYDFHIWDGELWKPDEGGRIRTLILSQLSSLYKRYISDIQNKINDLTEEDADDKEKYIQIKKKIIKRIQRCYTKKHTDNVIPLIAAELFDKNFMPKLNSNKDIISCNNGVIELNNNGKLRKHRIDDYCTYKLKLDYPEEGIMFSTSEIEEFFSDIMLNDKKMVEYLQYFLGYTITGHIREQKFVVFWGELGGNGKSVLIELLRHVLEEKKLYATLSGSSLLKNRKSSPGSATPHLLPLFGTRIAILDESDKAVKLNEGMIKRITGNKTCTVRPLFKEEFTFEMMAQPILITNFRPDISNDAALHRRLILIPFDAEFKDLEEFDKNNPKHRIKDKKKQEKLENNSQQLLVWLVQGAIKWYRNNGLPEFPEKIKNATQRYKLESDELYNFLNDADICELPIDKHNFDQKEYFTSTTDLLGKYMIETGVKCKKKDFRDMMIKQGFKEIKVGTKNGYSLKLISEYLLSD